MTADDQFLRAIDSLYEAAVDDSRWAEALSALSAVTGSQAATFWVLDSSDQPRLPTLTCFNFDPVFIGEYHKGMIPLDPTVQYLVAHPHAPIVHDGLVITERDKDRHAYYDWHGRHSDTRFRMVGQAHPASQVQAGVALHRAGAVGRYEPRDVHRFAVLHRHLTRALAIAVRLGTLTTLQHCTMELFDRNPAAIVLLDERGRVVYANRSALELSTRGEGIKIGQAGVRLVQSADNARLQAAIGRAMPQTAGGTPLAGAIRVTRPEGRQPYGLYVTPIRRDYAPLSSVRPAVCLMLTDPDRRRPSLATRLRVMFGLTEAEARLADALAAGDDLRTAASKLEITYGTSRVRLADIFQKTNTHRQGELVSLLLTVAATD